MANTYELQPDMQRALTRITNSQLVEHCFDASQEKGCLGVFYLFDKYENAERVYVTSHWPWRKPIKPDKVSNKEYPNGFFLRFKRYAGGTQAEADSVNTSNYILAREEQSVDTYLLMLRKSLASEPLSLDELAEKEGFNDDIKNKVVIRTMLTNWDGGQLVCYQVKDKAQAQAKESATA